MPCSLLYFSLTCSSFSVIPKSLLLCLSCLSSLPLLSDRVRLIALYFIHIVPLPSTLRHLFS